MNITLKRTLLALTASLFIVGLLTGCGDYDDGSVDYNELNNEVETLREDYDSLRSEFDTLNEEYSAFRDTVETELELGQ